MPRAKQIGPGSSFGYLHSTYPRQLHHLTIDTQICGYHISFTIQTSASYQFAGTGCFPTEYTILSSSAPLPSSMQHALPVDRYMKSTL
jgi:hypothetical protein